MTIVLQTARPAFLVLLIRVDSWFAPRVSRGKPGEECFQFEQTQTLHTKIVGRALLPVCRRSNKQSMCRSWIAPSVKSTGYWFLDVEIEKRRARKPVVMIQTSWKS
jgi:hypothetical protein